MEMRKLGVSRSLPWGLTAPWGVSAGSPGQPLVAGCREESLCRRGHEAEDQGGCGQRPWEARLQTVSVYSVSCHCLGGHTVGCSVKAGGRADESALWLGQPWPLTPSLHGGFSQAVTVYATVA